MSDKRLLKRCGNRKGYLIEARSVSVEPSGSHIRRAGDSAKMTSVTKVKSLRLGSPPQNGRKDSRKVML
jgi:hypothetical protein